MDCVLSIFLKVSPIPNLHLKGIPHAGAQRAGDGLTRGVIFRVAAAIKDGAPRAGVLVRDWVEDEILRWCRCRCRCRLRGVGWGRGGRRGGGEEMFAAEGEAAVEVEGGSRRWVYGG